METRLEEPESSLKKELGAEPYWEGAALLGESRLWFQVLKQSTFLGQSQKEAVTAVQQTDLVFIPWTQEAGLRLCRSTLPPSSARRPT